MPWLRSQVLITKGIKMGFWNRAFQATKDVGTTVLAQVEESANKSRELKQKYEELNDEDLFQIVHSDGFFGKNTKEKGVAFGILRRRGHSVDEINSRK